jgi:hypothetical protein
MHPENTLWMSMEIIMCAYDDGWGKWACSIDAHVSCSLVEKL